MFKTLSITTTFIWTRFTYITGMTNSFSHHGSMFPSKCTNYSSHHHFHKWSRSHKSISLRTVCKSPGTIPSIDIKIMNDLVCISESRRLLLLLFIYWPQWGLRPFIFVRACSSVFSSCLPATFNALSAWHVICLVRSTLLYVGLANAAAGGCFLARWTLVHICQ